MKKCRVVVCRETYFHIDVEAEDRHQAMEKAEKLVKAGVDIDKFVKEEEIEATVVIVNHTEFGQPVEKIESPKEEENVG